MNLTVVFTRTVRAEVGIGGFTYLDIHIYVKPTAPVHLWQFIFIIDSALNGAYF